MTSGGVLKRRLYAPGPVEVPPAVLEVLSRPMFMHRGQEFRRLLGGVREGLSELFLVPGEDVVVVSGSGTAAFEAALGTALPRPGKVVAVTAGKFGERWGKVASRHGHRVVAVEFPWGEAVDAARLAAVLAEHPDAAAVTTTHSETSTGALHDVEEIARTVRRIVPDALVVVDAVTSLAASELRPREWDLDVVVSGSQKGLMLPPGLGFAWLSERAWGSAAGGSSHGFYLDLVRERASQARGETAFTPAVNLIAGLEVSLELIRDYGLERLWRRRELLNRAVLAAGAAIGLAGFAHRPSPAVAAMRTPEGVPAPDLVRTLAEVGITISGGQDQAKPYLVRPSLLGWSDEHDAVLLAGALESGLRRLGLDVAHGAAAGAAMAVLERERI